MGRLFGDLRRKLETVFKNQIKILDLQIYMK